MRYFISAKLNAKYSKENIKHILERGSTMAYKYYAYEFASGKEKEFETLDLAVEALMMPNGYDFMHIYLKKSDIEDAGLYLGVCDYGDHFSFSMEELMDNDDLLECVSNFLILIKDFALLHIDTMID